MSSHRIVHTKASRCHRHTEATWRPGCIIVLKNFRGCRASGRRCRNNSMFIPPFHAFHLLPPLSFCSNSPKPPKVRGEHRTQCLFCEQWEYDVSSVPFVTEDSGTQLSMLPAHSPSQLYKGTHPPAHSGARRSQSPWQTWLSDSALPLSAFSLWPCCSQVKEKDFLGARISRKSLC